MYKWFIVTIKSNTRIKLNHLLSRHSIVHYWPQVKNSGLMAVYKPLFAEYIFIYIDNIQVLRESFRLGNYFNIVYWLDQPAVLLNEEIVAIRNFLVEHENVSLKQIAISTNHLTAQDYERHFQTEAKLILSSIGYMITGRKILEEEQNWKQELLKLSFGYSA